MKLFGLNISRIKQKAMTAVNGTTGWWRVIGEPFSGAWQRNQEEKIGDVLTYPTLYACLNRVSQDIGKMPFILKESDSDGIWRSVDSATRSPVLKTPNGYQTPQQFRESWALSILQHGNTYILKGRDARGEVNKLYVLDPHRVMPMVADSGDVYYQINYPLTENLLPDNYPADNLIIPAREIIHDRLNAFHHQLIGVPPVAAAYWPTIKNLKILKNSAEFFGNAAQPGGILTGPAGMTESDAKAVKEFWDDNYTGKGRGKIAVIGADLKYTSFAMNSVDSQLVEQMRYSDEQICQPFGIPPFKVGIGAIPAGLGVDAINQLYYSDALQSRVQAMETLLTEALGLDPLRVDVDEMELMRMDSGGKASYHSSMVSGGIEAINEARREFNLGPLEGGDTVYMQQQDFPLDQVRQNRIISQTESPVIDPPPVTDEEDEEKRLITMDLNRYKAIEAARNIINAT